jgi:hypothetical protein
VTAFDLLEHLAKPAETLGSLAASMRSGGLIALNVEEPDVGFPQHVATYEEVCSSVAATGFRRLQFLEKTEVFERVEQRYDLHPLACMLGKSPVRCPVSELRRCPRYARHQKNHSQLDPRPETLVTTKISSRIMVRAKPSAGCARGRSSIIFSSPPRMPLGPSPRAVEAPVSSAPVANKS